MMRTFWPFILLLVGLAGLVSGADTDVTTKPGVAPKPDGAMKMSIPRDTIVAHPTPTGKAIEHVAPSQRTLQFDHIWCGVIVATNPERIKDAPAELREFAPRLKRIFGYTQFELAGSASEQIDELTENWLVPSPIFPIKVSARRATSKEARGGYLLNLQFYQANRPLVDSEVKLAPGSPLFIRGPEYGKGQIIIVLKIER